VGRRLTAVTLRQTDARQAVRIHKGAAATGVDERRAASGPAQRPGSRTPPCAAHASKGDALRFIQLKVIFMPSAVRFHTQGRPVALARVAGYMLFAAGLAACGDTATLQPSAGVGASPTLPRPVTSLIPTVHIAPAKGWPAGQMPTPMPGLAVQALAAGLDHPRWVYVLPNGDVLVAESNAPPKPEDSKGIKGWVMKQVMARAGAGVPSANRITLLRDADGDGQAEVRTVFLQNLNSPFGMALVGSDLYIANSDAVVRFPYQPGQTSISAAPAKVVDLPAGPINHHWTKNVIASADGSRLYVTVGSNSNVAENGMAAEEGRAAIWEVDPKTGSQRHGLGAR
jgi:glucose/arabinose dehydrogenase